MRRCLDLIVASLGLMVTSPILIAAAVLVRCGSAGPVLFRQRRVGLDGREFAICKFRTMAVGADRGSALTARDDPRITRLGRFLRKWKIDELPQLLNVLRGDMTLVGPRPEAPAVVGRYTVHQREVLSVRPGITGPSQIRWRDEEACLPSGVDTEEYYVGEILPQKISTDLQYVRNRSLFRDVGYLCQTVVAVARPSPRQNR